MFKYKMRFIDAIQAYTKYTGSGAVVFEDPALNQFYADEAEGLCTIQLIAPDAPAVDSMLEIHYFDPELEFQRRLQF
jgi:hypothetical protein